MKRARFTEDQIIGVLKEHEAADDRPVLSCRRRGPACSADLGRQIAFDAV
jgi:hypothetical protein